MNSLSIDDFGSKEAGALCCATAIRIGGALGVLSDRVSLGDQYRHVDRGLRCMLLFYQGQNQNSDVVAEAFAASWHLGTVFPSESQVAQFFRSGLNVADFAIMASKAEDRSVPLRAALRKALETARLWPGPIHKDAPLGLLEFESSCQTTTLMRLQSGGIPAMNECIENQSRRYRIIAESFTY